MMTNSNSVTRPKIMSVFGTRPEAIKMAPLVKEFAARNEFISRVCVTAQHREMLDSVLDCFDITADFDLDIMAHGQTLTDVTNRVLEKLGTVLSQERPDLVLVHGDTTTAFAGALAAFYERIPVGHVEAGLRTFDRYSPFPEEMNRSLVGRLASLHFAPTAQNADNLRREGITDGVFITGNTVIDAMRYTVADHLEFNDPTLRDLDWSGKRVIAMTCHRRENMGQPMTDIFTAVRHIAEDFDDVEIVYPVHLSPAVREAAARELSFTPNIRLIEPLDAIEMHNLLARCYMVMTDSGGLQEEAPALGKPVLVLRRETERPEAVEAGCVELAGVDTDTIRELSARLLTDEAKYLGMARAVNPYGDGNAGSRIADAISWHFGLTDQKPLEFKA